MKRAIFLAASLLLVGCQQQSAEELLKQTQLKSAKDFEEQYEMARRAKASSTDLCVRAGLVAEGYLQAKDEEKYRYWKVMRDLHCTGTGAY